MAKVIRKAFVQAAQQSEHLTLRTTRRAYANPKQVSSPFHSSGWTASLFPPQRRYPQGKPQTVETVEKAQLTLVNSKMDQDSQDIRTFLIIEAFRFIDRVVATPGIRRIALLGSILTTKVDPKDVDLLITVDNDTDLTALAIASRKLKGSTQTRNKGADIFLANPAGEYIGRVCHWRNCGPHFRSSCDAWHCGMRQYLHDDFGGIRLNPLLVKEPPLEIWPAVVYRQVIAKDLLPFLEKYVRNSGKA